MKRSYTFSLFTSFLLYILYSGIGYSYGQGMINSGASVNMSGGATIYISGSTGNYTNENGGQITAGSTDNIMLEGNWINNASNTVFTDNGGIVSMLGNNESIGGTNSTSFNTVLLEGTGTTTLGSDILVGGGYSSPSGLLNLNNQPLDLNGHTLTISNPIPGTSSTGAIQYNSGYIISEQDASINNSIITWEMGGAGNIGDHIFPFGTAGGTQIPVIFTIVSAGNTNISASTRRTIDNDCAPNPAGTCNQPWTAGVANMYGFTGTDISVSSVIDRWWQIDPSSPVDASLTLTYQGAENTTDDPTGTFTAEEWRNNKWNFSYGDATGVTSGTGTVFAYEINTFGTIVLAEEDDELPISMVSFESSCLTNGTMLSWTTATEENTAYFTVERSFDGQNFTALGEVKAAGNSASTRDYSYLDTTSYSSVAYYRLAETDVNSNTKYFQVITADCHITTPFALVIYPNPNQGNYLNVHLSGLQNNSNVELQVVDMLGRQVVPPSYHAADENGTLISGLDLNYNLPKGIYNLVIQTGGSLMTRSFVIQ
jgi:hypothetical protein